jgi:hypothetical protein
MNNNAVAMKYFYVRIRALWRFQKVKSFLRTAKYVQNMEQSIVILMLLLVKERLWTEMH